MDRLLRQLHTETFVLNARNAIATAPQIPGYGVVRVDDHTLEVEVSKDRNLNDAFAALSAGGVEIVSMRNKVNRLEEVFMRLTDKSASARAGQA
jgi:ABC-2 type transport system ATP-binding protein